MNRRSGKVIPVLLAIAVMVSAPFFALANEDLELIERSTGPSGNGMLGWNITSVMDLNGDGDMDYAIGAPGSNMVYIFHGPMPASYSINSANWRISGPSSSDFGWSVSGVEDYDSDGFNDLIIGAPGVDKAYVFRGRSSAPGSISYTSAAITIEGLSGDLFGHAVAATNYDNTSDPDYDGFIYAVIGAPLNTHFVAEAGMDIQSGAAFLFNLTYLDSQGISTINTTQSNLTFNGGQNNGQFGFSVANLGNIDGDPNNIQDISITDPFFDKSSENENGAVYLQLGKSIFLEQRVVFSTDMDGYIYGTANSRFGWSIKALGDISPTPEADFAVGAPWEDQTNPAVPNVGCAHVFYGATGSFQLELSSTTTADIQFWGLKTGDRMGWSVARADIVDQNKRSLAVGAPGYDNSTSANAGAVFAFWDWSFSQNYSSARSKYFGVSSGDNLGYSMEGVYYRSDGPDDIRIMASAPYFGSGNTGSIDLFKRNLIPEMKNLFITPMTGNTQTDFEIKLQYQDFEGNIPEYVKVYMYEDAAGTNVIDTFTLTNSEGTNFEKGVNFTTITKLPSSITSIAPNKPLYFRAETRALRGSKDVVTLPTLEPFRAPKVGPVVDGVAPSEVTDIYEGVQGPDENEEGIFKIGWTWPEENADFEDPSPTGKIKRLTLAIREGANNELTEANWNDVGRLDEGKTVYYKNFSNEDIKTYLAQTSGFYLGRESDPEMNPNNIQLTPMTYYCVAFRAVDEQDNWGPVSENLVAETWWRRPDIPIVPRVDLLDYSDEDDNGHMINISWVVNIVLPEDLSYYHVFVNDGPFDSLDDLSKTEPDYNITKADDYESFLDRYIIVDSYWIDGVETELQTGSSYYVTVVAFNWLHQSVDPDDIAVEGPVKVIDNDALSIPLLQNVEAVNHLDDGHHVLLTWEQVNDPTFVEYQIWGQAYYFSNIQDAFLIDNITDRTTTQLVINEVGDEEIYQANEYFFSVLVLDYNGHIDTEIDQNNTASVKTFDPNGDPIDQVKGVSLKDVGNDLGGVLQVNWFNLIAKGSFWKYHVYFSDEPFDIISEMTPIAEIGNYRTGIYEIDQFQGEPLIDGKMYYVAVTMVSWDLVENTQIDENNYDFAEPVNQSDTTPPQITVSNLGHSEETKTENSFEVYWDPVTEEELQDFNHYLIEWSGVRSGSQEIFDRSTGSYKVSGLNRGEQYWYSVTLFDDNDNMGPATDQQMVITDGVSVPPTIEMVTISAGELDFNRTMESPDEVLVVKESELGKQDIYFVANVDDDYTSISRLDIRWNITTPNGLFINRMGNSFPLEITETGTYMIVLEVEDDEGGISDPLTITLEIKPEAEDEGPPAILWIGIFVLVVLVAAGVVVFVLVSGKRSQQKQMVEQYEERRKDIETMEPIYTNLPTWTCDCGTTQAKIIENAYCNSCYQSHEAVPTEGIDEYLKDHELVLTEMRIAIPIGWEGQDMAIENAKKDLEDRKERALKALNQEYAQWLKGTEYESEIPEEEEEEGGGGQNASLLPTGAIIPGQMPPSSPGQPTPMTPQPPAQAPLQGQMPPAQASPMQPRPMGAPGQPQPIKPGNPPNQ